MRLLLLGGGEFVGRALLDAALARGWSVTVANRGTHPLPAGLPPEAAHLRLDRRSPDDLRMLGAAAGEGRWDAVADTWSWEPVAVRDTARALAPHLGRYLYISSRSVYADPLPAGADESAALVEGTPDAGPGDDDGLDASERYAHQKAGSERAVVEAFGTGAILVRPGLILGPHENVGRLPWWLSRMDRADARAGGEVLAPGDPGGTFQYIDARDLAGWSLELLEQGVGGPFDAVSPRDAHTLGELLEDCIAVTGSRARLRWLPERELLDAGVAPWTDLPVWLPAGEAHDALHGSDVSKALAAGLTIRPLRETVRDTWAWLQELGEPPLRTDQTRPDQARPDQARAGRPRLGLPPEVERRILERAGGWMEG